MKSRLNEEESWIRRRDNVIELLSTGYTNLSMIATKLNIPLRTAYRDANYWSQVSDEDMHQHFKSLPLEIKKGIVLNDLTIRELTEFMNSDNVDSNQWLQASRDRIHASEYRQRLVDGKARLREVFGLMDSANKTLNVTGKNIEVIRDGNKY